MAFTQEQFAAAILKRLNLPLSHANVKALVGWENAEGGHWHNDARFNPLNTTEPAPGAGNTGSQGNIKVYRSPQQGVNATVRTLKNGRYGGILSALAKGNNPRAVAAAIDASPWGTHGALVYNAIDAAHPGAILHATGIGSADGAAASPAGGLEHVDIANKQTFDQAGFEDAQRRQLVAGLIAKHRGTDSALFKTGLLSTAAPNPADFSSSTLTSRIVQDAPSGARAPSGPAVRLNGRTGKVAVAAGANRAGVGISPLVTRFVRGLAGIAGHPLTIGTGTNHNRMTTTGNVSDHWDGHAADIPSSGAALTKLGQQALIAAGMAPGRARQQKGGVYNLQHDGHRVQILFNTNVGGNHWNHLHVGVR